MFGIRNTHTKKERRKRHAQSVGILEKGGNPRGFC